MGSIVNEESDLFRLYDKIHTVKGTHLFKKDCGKTCGYACCANCFEPLFEREFDYLERRNGELAKELVEVKIKNSSCFRGSFVRCPLPEKGKNCAKIGNGIIPMACKIWPAYQVPVKKGFQTRVDLGLCLNSWDGKKSKFRVPKIAGGVNPRFRKAIEEIVTIFMEASPHLFIEWQMRFALRDFVVSLYQLGLRQKVGYFLLVEEIKRICKEGDCDEQEQEEKK